MVGGGEYGIKSPCFLWLSPHLDNLVLGRAEEELTWPTEFCLLSFG